jgi:hypothetical protein
MQGVLTPGSRPDPGIEVGWYPPARRSGSVWKAPHFEVLVNLKRPIGSCRGEDAENRYLMACLTQGLGFTQDPAIA